MCTYIILKRHSNTRYPSMHACMCVRMVVNVPWISFFFVYFYFSSSKRRYVFWEVDSHVSSSRYQDQCIEHNHYSVMHVCMSKESAGLTKKKPYSCSILKYHNFHEGKWSFILSVRIEQLFLFLFPSLKKCVWLIVGIFILIHSLLRTFFNFLGILVFWLELVCKIKHFVVFIAANYRFHPKNTKLRSSTICLKQTENLSSFLWKKIIKIN